MTRTKIIAWFWYVTGAVLVVVAAVLMYRSSRTPAKRVSAPKPAIMPISSAPSMESEAIAMARALRTYYPFAREADDLSYVGWDCAKKAKGAAAHRACVSDYEPKLAKIRGRLPTDGGLSGCALTVAKSIRAGFETASGEKDPDLGKRMGIPFGDIHRGIAECAARLFLVEVLRGKNIPPKPTDLAAHLGLRDEELPSESTYTKQRMGKLLLADGREIDRATLQVK